MKRELRIGIFVGAALLIAAVFVFIVGDLSVLFKPAGYPVFVDFESAAGLENRSVVKMSGVKIGHVEDIKLSRKKARITLSISPGVEIPKDSKATTSSLGLLGEKYMEIIPGDSPENCRPGGTLGSQAVMGFDQIGGLLQSVGTEVTEAGRAVKDALGPETRANLNKTIENLAVLSSDLTDLVGRNRAEIGKTVDEAGRAFRNLSLKIDEAAAGLNDTVRLLKDIAAENRENVKIDLQGIKSLIGKIEESLKLLNAALEKATKGEGTVGKLLQDPALYDKAEKAVDDIGVLSRSVSSLRVEVDVRAEDLPKSGLVRPVFELGVRVSPRAFFEAGLVRDPWKSEFAFSLLGGYRVGDFAPRFGLIESQFGVGLDCYAWNDAGMIRAEGFDFNRPGRPRFRLSARFAPWPSLYFILGGDELALAARREIFFGLGVTLR